MTGRPVARIRIEAGSITITVPLDAPRTLYLGAARHAHDMAQRHVSDAARQDETGRLMRGRAGVFELHRRKRSWKRTLDVILGDEPGDQLVEDVRRWVRARSPDLGSNGGENAIRQLKTWANKQDRYATDADYAEDETDWVPPSPPPWRTGG